MDPVTSPPDPRPGGSRRLFRALTATVVALPLILGAAACGGDDAADKGTTINVFWWGGDKRAALTHQALELYKSKHPDVTFNEVWQANAGYFDKLNTNIAGNNAPDLFQIDDNYLSEYAQRGVTLDLSPYVDSKKLDVSKFPQSLVQYGQVDGKQVAVAAAENTPGLIYNKTLLTNLGLPEPTIGETYEQFIDWAAQVTAKSGGKVYGTMDPSADYKALWLWLRAQGKEFYNGTKIAFTEQDLTAWFELWKTARDKKAAPPADVIHEANGGDVTKQLVVSGKAATSFMWSNQLPELQKNTKDDLAVTAYPGDPKGQWARASMYWTAYKGTKHADVVVDVINFLLNDPEAGKILGVERGLSSNTEVRATVAATLTDAKMKASVDFENAIAPKFGAAPPPPPKGHGKVKTALVTAAENVQYGKETPQQAAAEFLAQAAQELAG